MAQKYLDMMDQEKARTFKDFEDEWVALGEELCLNVFQPGNSPKEEENTQPISPKKRKRHLSETEDSYILNQRRVKQQKKNDDDRIITNLRKRDPLRFKNLVERIGKDGTRGCWSSEGLKTVATITRYSPQLPECSAPATSTGFLPQSPSLSLDCSTTATITGYSPQSPDCTIMTSEGLKAVAKITRYSPPQSPECSALTSEGLKAVATITRYTPQLPECSAAATSTGFLPQSPSLSLDRSTNATITGYSPQSPDCSTTATITGYSPQSPDCNTTATITGYSPKSPGQSNTTPPMDFLKRVVGGAFPLHRELGALHELVDSMRVDLLQTSMLLDYVKDFLKSYKF